MSQDYEKEYGMRDIAMPMMKHHTVWYYYASGKVVGSSRYIDKSRVHFDADGNIIDNPVEYATWEKVVDNETYRQKVTEFNKIKNGRIDKFIEMLETEHDVSNKEAWYFFNKYRDDGFDNIVSEVDEFVDACK